MQGREFVFGTSLIEIPKVDTNSNLLILVLDSDYVGQPYEVLHFSYY